MKWYLGALPAALELLPAAPGPFAAELGLLLLEVPCCDALRCSRYIRSSSASMFSLVVSSKLMRLLLVAYLSINMPAVMHRTYANPNHMVQCCFKVD